MFKQPAALPSSPLDDVDENSDHAVARAASSAAPVTAIERRSTSTSFGVAANEARQLAHADRVYGLGALITRQLGFRELLWSITRLSIPAPPAAFLPATTQNHDDTPASADTLDLPSTPEDAHAHSAHPQRRPWRFARDAPPKIQWRAQPPSTPRRSSALPSLALGLDGLSETSDLPGFTKDADSYPQIPSVHTDDDEGSVPTRFPPGLTGNDAGHTRQVVNHKNLYNVNRSKYPDTAIHAGVSYSVIGVLGHGSYGRVFLAITDAGEHVALKVIHKARYFRDPQGRSCLLAERDCMATAMDRDIPFWMKLRAAWHDEQNIFFAMDVCGGTLRDRQQEESLSHDEVRLICAELLLALVALEYHRVIHGDIKPENIFISRTGHAMLGDFGCSQLSTEWLGTREEFAAWRGRIGGSAGYIAPEALPTTTEAYLSHGADIFSMGLVFMELMAGLRTPVWDVFVVPSWWPRDATPWQDIPEWERQLLLTRHDAGFSAVSEDDLPRDSLGWDLCMKMVRDRAPVEHLMAHPYFKGLNFGLVEAQQISHDYTPAFPKFTVESEKMDLMFVQWHRGLDPDLDGVDGGAGSFTAAYDVGNNVRYSRWIRDNVNVLEQKDIPLDDFDYPPLDDSPVESAGADAWFPEETGYQPSASMEVMVSSPVSDVFVFEQS